MQFDHQWINSPLLCNFYLLPGHAMCTCRSGTKCNYGFYSVIFWFSGYLFSACPDNEWIVPQIDR